MMNIIPKSLYPNVPNLPGVPDLLRDPSALISVVAGVVGLTQASERLFGTEKTVWGLFDKTGALVVQATSILSVDYQNSSRVSDYTVEQGAFASYNKVANPFDVRVRMVCDGTTPMSFSSLLNPLDVLSHKATRTSFIDALDAAANSLDLYTVVTPEKTFTNVNLESWDFRRETTNGASIVIADLRLVEVRETASAAFSLSVSTSAADPQPQGQVQAAPVTPAQDASIVSAAKVLKGIKSGGGGVFKGSGATGSWGISTGGATGSW
jgi:hypothetical protein